MAKSNWGPRDVAALQRYRKLYLSPRTAAADLGASTTSLSHWMRGESPRYPEAVRTVLIDRECYSVRRKKA